MNFFNSQTRLKGRVGKILSSAEKQGETDARISFTLATNDASYKDDSGQWQDVTSWHTLEAWGTVAEALIDKIGKGDYLDVLGQYKNADYDDKDGNRQYGMKLKIGRFEILKQGRQKQEA